MENCISVIIPTYNRKGTLGVVLPSYLSQKFVKEVIIVDDGSDYDVDEFISPFRDQKVKILVLKNERNMGTQYSKNAGVERASGDFIFIGEDDVELEEGHLAQLFSCIQKGHADILCGFCISMFLGDEKWQALNRFKKTINKKNYPYLNFDYQFKEVDYPVFMTSGLMFIRREVFGKVLFSVNYPNNAFREETDFQMRCLKNGFSIYLCPHTVCFHLAQKVKQGGCIKNTSRFIYEINSIENEWKFLNKHYEFLKKNNLIIWNNKYLSIIVFAINRFQNNVLFYLRKLIPQKIKTGIKKFLRIGV